MALLNVLGVDNYNISNHIILLRWRCKRCLNVYCSYPTIIKRIKIFGVHFLDGPKYPHTLITIN
jgi:hypothetical protein